MPYSAQALPVLERFVDSGITKQHLEEASQLFSTHYATWGPLAATQLGPWAEAGKRVKMSPQRLKRECLAAAEEEGRLAGDGAAGAARTEGVVDVHNEYVRAFVICNGDGKSAPKVVDTESATGESTRLASSSQPERQIVGHVFATRWRDGQGRRVCWITQVVVHREWRRRGIATAVRDILLSYHIYKRLNQHPPPDAPPHRNRLSDSCLDCAHTFRRPLLPHRHPPRMRARRDRLGPP